MTKEKAPGVKDWQNRPLDKWTATTFQTYLAAKVYEKYHVTYVPYRGYGADIKLIKSNIEEMGNNLLKELIDEALREYQPTDKYPSLTFSFIHTFQKPRILPRLQKKQQKAEKTAQYKQQTEMEPIDLDWI
jgi:hypothetical protein